MTKVGHDKNNGLDFLATFAKNAIHRHRKIDLNHSINIVVNNAVMLAERFKFKRMSDALGSKIEAAHACKEFEQYMDRDEKNKLKTIKCKKLNK